MKFLASFFAVLLLTAGAHAEDSWSVVHAGELLAVPGQPTVKNKSVIIKNGRVTEIRDGFASAADLGLDEGAVDVIDLSGSFVLPGLMDLHTHITGQVGVGNRKLDSVTLSRSFLALRATVFARRTLEAGITTIRNVGADPEVIFALRDAIKAGHVAGPRIFAAGGGIGATGGHGDIHGYRDDVMAVLAQVGRCDGADACRKAVRAKIKQGADLIKIAATGGVLSETATGTGVQMTPEEMRAVVETAHSLGRKVAAHAHAANGINAAVRAGVDSIEHGMWPDKDTYRLMKEHGTYLVPTVYPITYVGDTPEKMKKGPFRNAPPAIMAKLLELADQPKIVVRGAVEAGVKIAMGTDAAIFPHGLNTNEFVEYVEAGMTPMQSIMTGTVNAADLLGQSAQLGSLEPGKAADLIATAKSPLEDITEVTRVTFVMRDGIVFKGR